MQQIREQVARGRLTQQQKPVAETSLAATTAKLTSADISDKGLPQLLATRIPTELAGLLIAAIFSAAMSSMDTSLNSSATVVYCDIYRCRFRPDADERQSMRVLRIVTLIYGAMEDSDCSGDAASCECPRRLMDPAGSLHRRHAWIVFSGPALPANSESARADRCCGHCLADHLAERFLARCPE